MAQPISQEYVTLGDLTMSAHEPDTGITWVLEKFVGWGSPASSISTSKRTRAHGVWAGDSFLAARNLALSGWVGNGTAAAADEAIDRLIEATSLVGVSLSVVGATGARWCAARRTDEVLVTRRTDTSLSWSIQLVAPDPRKYGAPLTGTTGLPAVSGGLTVPFTVPLSIPSTVTSGRVVLTNAGNIAAPVTMRLTGPSSGALRGPIITHQPSGRRLVFGPDRVVPAGEFWDILPSRQVLAGGTEPRTGWLVDRGWPELVPGENTFHLSAIEGGPGASLSVSSWSAWQ